jgi:hypothetical protein
VLSAIDFDDARFLAAHKVADVALDRQLPYEFVSVDLPVTNAIPEDSFRVSLTGAQSSRNLDSFTISAAHDLTSAL